MSDELPYCLRNFPPNRENLTRLLEILSYQYQPEVFGKRGSGLNPLLLEVSRVRNVRRHRKMLQLAIDGDTDQISREIWVGLANLEVSVKQPIDRDFTFHDKEDMAVFLTTKRGFASFSSFFWNTVVFSEKDSEILAIRMHVLWIVILIMLKHALETNVDLSWLSEFKDELFPDPSEALSKMQGGLLSFERDCLGWNTLLDGYYKDSIEF